ncbi:uncharacterized protein LOC131158675 [Malania oleifera]|uniref:uncharacterized protein LOC131158675 n=1 Tax=Malania oleifera TaxID=397392 RepID=UPI0025AEB44F|nr:uncharacterized protein LOC131158675 [Malania oleifera]
MEDYQPMEFDFSDKDIDSVNQVEEDHEGWTMMFDGVANVWRHGIGAVLISPKGKHYPVSAKLTFPCTNNIVEYEACALGLQAAKDRGIRELTVKGDSTLVIHQLIGEWEMRDSKLIPYQEKSNLIPDALATLAALVKVELGIEIVPIRIRMQSEPAYYVVNEEVDGKSWFYDIKTYLQKQECPEGASSND